MVPLGPAAQAGLAEGDVVTAVGATHIDADHPLDPAALGLAVDQQVTVTVSRSGTSLNLSLVVGSSGP